MQNSMRDSSTGGWGPVPKPWCEFGESRILVENTYQMTKIDASMTDNLIQRITKDRAWEQMATEGTFIWIAVIHCLTSKAKSKNPSKNDVYVSRGSGCRCGLEQRKHWGRGKKPQSMSPVWHYKYLYRGYYTCIIVNTKAWVHAAAQFISDWQKGS